MSLFYVKDGEIFLPENINPELLKLAKAIVKTCRLTFKLQMKTTSLENAKKSGDKDQMFELMQKAMEKNRSRYNDDMALSGVKLESVDDAFFADKDAEFFRHQLDLLIGFASLNVVIDAKMFPLMANACEKTLNKPINEVLFFTNQTEILAEEDVEEDAGTDADTEAAE